MEFYRSRNKSRVMSQHMPLGIGQDVAFAVPDAAPFDEPLQVKVKDASGAEYRLPFAVKRTDLGWFNADLGTALGKGIEVVGWRRRDFAK